MSDSVNTGDGQRRNDSVYRLMRLGAQLLVFLALVAVSTVLLRPLQRAIQSRMEGLRDDLLSRAELVLDRRIEYGSIGPSLFGALDIRNIRIYADGPEPALAIDRFRVAYSLWDLARGKLPEAIRSVRIDRPVIALDLKRYADRGGSLEGAPETGWADPRDDAMRRIAALIPEDLLIRVRGGEFRIKAELGSVGVEGLNFEARAEAGSFLFSGKWSAQAGLDGLFGQGLAAAMSGRVDGELSRDLNKGSVQLRVPALSGDFFNFRTLTANIALTERDIEIRKINDRLPVDFSLNYEFGARRVSGSFRAEGFSLRDLVSFTGPWRQYNPYLGIRSTGFASISHTPDGDTVYEIDLSGSLRPSATAGEVSYAVAGTGDQNYFGFTRCEFTLPQGELGYSGGLGLGPFAPNGTVHVKDFSLTGDGGINGDFAVSTAGRNINLFGETLSLGGVDFSALDGSLAREDAGLSFSLSALRFRNVESYEDVELATLSLEGAYDREPRHLQASLYLDSFPVSDLLGSVRPFAALSAAPEPLRAFAEDIAITTEVFVTTDFQHVLYNAPRLVAAYSGRRDVLALVSVSGTDRRFELSEGRVVWSDGSAEASGSADFSRADDIAFSFQTAYRDMFYFLEGEYLDQRSLSVRGSYGFQVSLSTTDAGGYSGYVEAASLPIPLGDQFARLSLLVSLRYDDADYWSVTVDHFDVQDLLTPVSAISSLSLSGALNQDGLRFRRIALDDGRGPLTGTAAASWGRGFLTPSGELLIQGQGGAEVARLSGSYGGEELELHFSGTAVQLGRFLRNSRNAELTGTADIRWRSLDSYSAAITLSELCARIGENDVSFAGSATINQDEVMLREFQARYNDLEGEFDLLRIDRRNSYASAVARIRGAFMGRNLDASLNTDISFVPIQSWFSLPRALDSFSGSLYVPNFRLDAIRSREPFSFAFSRSGARMSLSGGPGDMFRLQVSDDGAFYAAFANPAPLRGSVVGTIANNAIDAQTSGLYVDLGSLWRFVPGQETFNIPGGFAEVSAEIRGSLADPEFFGTARVNSLRIQVPEYVRTDIEPVPTTIRLEGNEMSFGPIPARVGTGLGMASGWFRFDRWAPNVYSLDIQVSDETPIPFGVDIDGIQADGDASGHLVLSMEDQVFRVTGDLVGNNAEINLDTRPFSPEQGKTAVAESRHTVTDLRITTGPKVEFVYPSRDFPLVRANAEAGTRLALTSDTLSGRFTVDGDVVIRSGEIFYFQRSFYIQEGMLAFDESELDFDPQISARAEARDRTDDGPVTISLIVDSSSLQYFTPRFESNPALSQSEIFSLLGQNLSGTSTEEDPNGSIRSFLMASSDFLAQFYVFRRVERSVREWLGLDMLSFRTNLVQNWAFQLTRIQEPVDNGGVLGNYFDNTTVFFGKYFGPDVFGQAMVSFRYDENRTTFGDFSQGGLTLGAGVSLEADLGVEFHGPLFDVQLNFAPRHLENMFVDDLSFTFLWKKSIKNLSDLWKEP